MTWTICLCTVHEPSLQLLALRGTEGAAANAKKKQSVEGSFDALRCHCADNA